MLLYEFCYALTLPAWSLMQLRVREMTGRVRYPATMEQEAYQLSGPYR